MFNLTEQEIKRLRSVYNTLGVNTNILTNEIVNIIINQNEIAISKNIEEDVSIFLNSIKENNKKISFEDILNFIYSLEKSKYILT